MVFSFKDYHPAASHPCLYPRLIPGKKRKRGDENEALEPFWHWYLIREFSGQDLKPKARTGEVALATFSSLLVRHVAEVRGRQLKVPQQKGVRFLTTGSGSDMTNQDSEEKVAVTKATYLRSKAPTAAWTRGEGPSQVDNVAMGMTTYGERGGQLKAEKTSAFLASAGGEAVKVENCTVEGVREMLNSESWLSDECLGAEWWKRDGGQKWCNREDDLPWAKVE